MRAFVQRLKNDLEPVLASPDPRPSISAYHDMPYALFRYDPDQEYLLRREVTMLFSDIRGFTSMSEKLSAEVVIEILNEYFAVMVPIIVRHRGTTNNFIGDADPAQHRTRHLREEHLHPVQPGRMRWGEDQLKTAGLAVEEALGLTRAVG